MHPGGGLRRDMSAIATFPLELAARRARLILVLGLVVGIFVPGMAGAVKPWIQEMIAALLFLAALRIGPRQILGVARDLGHSLAGVVVLQLALPLALLGVFMALGWSGVLPTALVLMTAAAPISGSPNLSIMTGNDPAPALRLLTMGTALLPATVIPVFWLAPALGDASDILAAAGKLLVVIAGSVGCAFVMRAIFFRAPSARAIRCIDGLSAIVMGAVVVGLMSAVGAALFATPGLLALNLGAAFATNMALQLAVAVALRRGRHETLSVPFAIAAGNRNIALFLTALPAAVTEPLLLFIGCYQIPMYLTPLILDRFYRTPTPLPATPRREWG